MIAGLWAEKFDQMAAFQNFIIMPMTFLSGVFYSIHSLPGFWQSVSHLNPFFYMIDGFRYGFFAHSDVSPWLSLGVVGTSLLLVASLGLGRRLVGVAAAGGVVICASYTLLGHTSTAGGWPLPRAGAAPGGRQRDGSRPAGRAFAHQLRH